MVKNRRNYFHPRKGVHDVQPQRVSKLEVKKVFLLYLPMGEKPKGHFFSSFVLASDGKKRKKKILYSSFEEAFEGHCLKTLRYFLLFSFFDYIMRIEIKKFLNE